MIWEVGQNCEKKITNYPAGKITCGPGKKLMNNVLPKKKMVETKFSAPPQIINGPSLTTCRYSFMYISIQ